MKQIKEALEAALERMEELSAFCRITPEGQTKTEVWEAIIEADNVERRLETARKLLIEALDLVTFKFEQGRVDGWKHKASALCKEIGAPEHPLQDPNQLLLELYTHAEPKQGPGKLESIRVFNKVQAVLENKHQTIG